MKEEDIIIFDIEANGLLDKITKVWVIAATNYDGSEQWIFTDQDAGKHPCHGNLEDGVKFLMKHKRIVCHNICGYDYAVLEKFFPHLWNRKTVKFNRIWDTLVQSKCQHFARPRLKGVRGNHSLEYYGVMFKFPKPPIEDWSYWDAAKLDRCLVDIEINRRAYHYLMKEQAATGLNFETQIRRTQAAQYWYTVQEMDGIVGNREKMEYYVADLDKQLEELKSEIEPNLPMKCKVIGPKMTWEELKAYWPEFYDKYPRTKYDSKGKPVRTTYKPVKKIFMKSGKYPVGISKHFDIPEDPDDSDYLVQGVFTRVKFEKSKMSQHAVVKEYLLSQGWKPTQWNYEKDSEGALKRDVNGNMIKKSPKLTEDSFDSIEGDIGNKIALYNTLTHRRRTFKNEKDSTKGWINQLRPDGRLPAGAMAWATETGRAAQKGCVNVPSASATYGAPMREVWEADEGKILISVDMDSAQIRLLANFMGDSEYTKAVLEGMEFDENHKYLGTDAHTKNAMAFGTLPEDLVQEAIDTQDPEVIKQCSDIRKTSKNAFFCLLFGGGDEKLANTLKIKGGAKEGKRRKQSFRSKLSKSGELQDRLNEQWKHNSFRKGGYIQVAGGTWVMCESQHKLLNYLLMGSEAVLQNQAICWVNAEMERRGLHGMQKLSIHDELTFEFPIEEEEEGLKLLTEMYGKASESIGLDVPVTGTAQSGHNWLEIH